MHDMVDFGPSRVEAKRAAILQAAERAFLEGGYMGTNVDQIASAASVSKQTIYKHFGDKGSLFRAVIAHIVEAAGEQREHPFIVGEDVRGDLRAIARHLIHGVMQDRVLQLRRVVIGEAARFPELGELFYELGPVRTIGRLADALEGLRQRGALNVRDVQTAAEHLNWLILSPALNRAMLLGRGHGLEPQDFDRQADAAVETFLQAYHRSFPSTPVS